MLLPNSIEPSEAYKAAWQEMEAQEGVALVKLFVDKSQLRLDFEAELVEYVEAREEEEYLRSWH